MRHICGSSDTSVANLFMSFSSNTSVVNLFISFSGNLVHKPQLWEASSFFGRSSSSLEDHPSLEDFYNTNLLWQKASIRYHCRNYHHPLDHPLEDLHSCYFQPLPSLQCVSPSLLQCVLLLLQLLLLSTLSSQPFIEAHPLAFLLQTIIGIKVGCIHGGIFLRIRINVGCIHGGMMVGCNTLGK
jgi:hypothetical protein